MDSLSARDRAIKLLNHRKRQYPPDIYYIRRNPDMLAKYSDPYKLHKLQQEAPSTNKHTYDLFKLDDKRSLYTSQQKKRVLNNFHDPYFTKYRSAFENKYDEIYRTDKVLGIISPRNHTRLRGSTIG